MKIEILDGGMGSELIQRGIVLPQHIWSAQANIESQEIIYKIHKEYKEAGASYLTTNTFRSTPRSYQKIGLNKKDAIQTAEISLKNAELLRQASPWGQGFEEPIFYGDFELVEQRIVGEKHLKCSLKLQGTNSVLEGIAFFQEKLQSKKVRAAYKLSVNSFRGNESLQLMIESIENIN